MLPEEFKDALSQKGIVLSDKQMAQFHMYFTLLVEWNKKMNLTAITEEKEVYLKHFYDSFLLSLFDYFDAAVSLCDVGSGAGFPSLPLKIIFPSLKITIVDSLNKRISFLQTVVETLQLDHVQLYHDRAETFGKNKAFREQFDLVTARAVARLNVLSELCLPLVKQKGYFLPLKAKKGQEELEEAKQAIALLGGKFEKEVHFCLPILNEKRDIFVIQKVKQTPKKYPRKPGTPNKQPLFSQS